MDSIARVSLPTPQVERTHFNGRLSLSLMVSARFPRPKIRASDVVSIDLLVATQFKSFTTDNVKLWAMDLHWFVFSTNGLQLWTRTHSCQNLVTTAAITEPKYKFFLLLCSQFIASDLCSQSNELQRTGRRLHWRCTDHWHCEKHPPTLGKVYALSWKFLSEQLM